MTRTVCPNCGEKWEGTALTGTPGAMHMTSNCCGCSEEYLAKLEASPTIALSTRLAEIERIARIGTNVPSSVALELVALLRQYMAFAEEVTARTEAMLKALPE
jgi:hypothetical protein